MPHNKQYALKVLCCQASPATRIQHAEGLPPSHPPTHHHFNEHFRYCKTGKQAGCIETDKLSGSSFQIYFHDWCLFQMHHVLLPLSASHLLVKERKVGINYTLDNQLLPLA